MKKYFVGIGHIKKTVEANSAKAALTQMLSTTTDESFEGAVHLHGGIRIFVESEEYHERHVNRMRSPGECFT